MPVSLTDVQPAGEAVWDGSYTGGGVVTQVRGVVAQVRGVVTQVRDVVAQVLGVVYWVRGVVM